MKKVNLVLSMVALLVMACSTTFVVTSTPASQTDMLGTIVAATMQALTSAPPVFTPTTALEQMTPTVIIQVTETPTAPANSNQILVSNLGKSFTIPQGVATGATVESLPAQLDPNMPIWDIYPAHDEFTLDGYALQFKFFAPKILFYPATEFSNVNPGAAQIINDMKALLANPSAPLPQTIPFLPLFNAAQVFHSNEQFLTFQNGTGIRFLTQFAQAPLPVNNHELFYTFQGITSDGMYYIAAILPVNAAFLVEDSEPDSTPPPDGIPFDWNNFESLPTYLDAVKQKLNATDPNSFTPPLSSLDLMMQSLSVTGNP